MKKIATVLTIALIAIACFSYIVPKKKISILVFSKTAGYRHSAIAEGKIALLKLGAEKNFSVDTTEDASYFTEKTLKKYSAVIFLSTNIFNLVRALLAFMLQRIQNTIGPGMPNWWELIF
jgi:uncharacterized protein